MKKSSQVVNSGSSLTSKVNYPTSFCWGWKRKQVFTSFVELVQSVHLVGQNEFMVHDSSYWNFLTSTNQMLFDWVKLKCCYFNCVRALFSLFACFGMALYLKQVLFVSLSGYRSLCFLQISCEVKSMELHGARVTTPIHLPVPPLAPQTHYTSVFTSSPLFLSTAL